MERGNYLVVLIYCTICVLQHRIMLTVSEESYISVSKEYCMETFSPTCDRNEVIIMQSALYGRMKIGRCVKKDYGKRDCLSNELGSLDKLCSGLQSCELTIPSPQLTANLPCLEELNPYLEAGYECQKVYQPKKANCRIPEHVKVSAVPGFIASSTSIRSNCGLHESPWVLEAQPGQQINIALVDFDWENSTTEDKDECYLNYGYILDLQSDDVINICGGGKRMKQVFKSIGHRVQIVLNAVNINKYRFLLKYQATGCPEFLPPRYAWVKEEDGGLLIGCEFSPADTWRLHCASTSWLGVIGNCTAPPSTTEEIEIGVKTEGPKEPGSLAPVNDSSVSHVTNNHVLAFALGCVTLVCCCAVVFIGIYCIRRHEIRAFKENDYSLPPTLNRRGHDDNHSTNYTPYSVLGTRENDPMSTRDLPPYPVTPTQVAPPSEHGTFVRQTSRQRLHSYNDADGNIVVRTANGEKHVYMSPNQLENLATGGEESNKVLYFVLENSGQGLPARRLSRTRSRIGSDGDESVLSEERNGGEQVYQSIRNFNTIV